MVNSSDIIFFQGWQVFFEMSRILKQQYSVEFFFVRTVLMHEAANWMSVTKLVSLGK